VRKIDLDVLESGGRLDPLHDAQEQRPRIKRQKAREMPAELQKTQRAVDDSM